jgi:RNA polymerase sigma-70 factor, ECF subfamily
MSLDRTTEHAVIAVIPSLRAFALSLCRNRDRADELVQETLASAIAHIGSFRKGTNLGAWLFTILRNHFNTDYRKRKREEHDVDDCRAEALTVPPDQVGWGIAADIRAGFAKLSKAQRQALILVGASGLSYGEAAVIAGCEVGTMKSRVHRARTTLAAFLSDEISAVGRAESEGASVRRAA